MTHVYRYDFNVKEHQPELGLNWHDYHARNYDAALGRWMNVDPLAEQAPSWTPYRYGFNNPVRYIDPDGRLETNYEDEFGNRLAETNDGNDATVIILNDNVGEFLEDFESTHFMQRDGSATNSNWINKYGVGMMAEEGAQIQPWAIEAMGYESNFKGLTIAFSAFVFTFGEEYLDGATFRLFNKKGTNFSPKLYRSGWKGGSAGQIKTYGMGGLTSTLKWTGRGIGMYNAYSVSEQHKNGQISIGQMITEQSTNIISTLGGVPGAAWGIGWQIGRAITNLPGYDKNVKVPLQKTLRIKH